MTILDTIIERKKTEIELAKQHVSEADLQGMELFGRTCYSLRESILHPERSGIIAEYKRASPSKGTINAHSTVEEVVRGYQQAGASAVSVLTDSMFFKGSMDDLKEARANLTIPLLRKDFVIDTYQILEAKAYGADIILLIAAVLTPEQVKSYAEYAKKLGLSVLLEVHNAEELQHNGVDAIDAIGVNNRNLHDFSVSVKHSLDLVDQIPDQYIKVSESGISDPNTIKTLKAAGFNGFLIGENFMKTPDPVQSIQSFIEELS